MNPNTSVPGLPYVTSQIGLLRLGSYPGRYLKSCYFRLQEFLSYISLQRIKSFTPSLSGAGL